MGHCSAKILNFILIFVRVENAQFCSIGNCVSIKSFIASILPPSDDGKDNLSLIILQRDCLSYYAALEKHGYAFCRGNPSDDGEDNLSLVILQRDCLSYYAALEKQGYAFCRNSG
jgi:hypothetical protein